MATLARTASVALILALAGALAACVPDPYSQKNGHTTNTNLAYAPGAPPPPRAETVPPPPSASDYWEPGHWAWNGSQWTWLPGHYEQRPTEAAVWQPGYWQKSPDGYHWVQGHWQ